MNEGSSKVRNIVTSEDSFDEFELGKFSISEEAGIKIMMENFCMNEGTFVDRFYYGLCEMLPMSWTFLVFGHFQYDGHSSVCCILM